MTEESLFELALNTPEAERVALLDRQCAGDPALRGRVESLLAAHLRMEAPSDVEATAADPGGSAATSTPDPPTATLDRSGETVDRGPAERVGTVLAGKYKLVEEIGEGGMGQVFLDQQTEPVKRIVAVKVIKAGMDSRAVLQRFEAERQALAMMDHPNIARVLDAGTTDAGRPFFVMELVKGVPITRFCDERRLTPRERLELFVPLCQAIQHAHQKGVIHRDIKPSNVLIALYDDRPVPKVIDFGVAKATGAVLTEHSLLTGFGAVVGTPEYMSPEQAGLNNLDVDTRSDVYALGVLLYELLTGSTPVDRKRLKQAAMLEVLRVVREEEPPSPSAKLSTNDTLPSVAASRGVEPARLSRLMRGELDWIVMKALEKDRGRRYETANAFARDVQRYLADEVVEARAPSAGYRLRKFVRRHRGRVIAASLVILALLGGIAGTTWGLVQADRQRDIALARKGEAEAALLKKDNANRILLSIFKDLNLRGDEAAKKPLAMRLGERLGEAATQLEAEAVDDPLGTARMRSALGAALIELGDEGKAVELLGAARAAFESEPGRHDDEALEGMERLVEAYRGSGDFERARPLMEEIVKRARARHGPDHPETLTALSNLGMVYQSGGDTKRALPLLEGALQRREATLPANHPDTLASLDNVASAYVAIGRTDRALPLGERALAGRKAMLPPDHPDTLASMSNLAAIHRALGRLDLALPLMEEAFEGVDATLGSGHRSTLKVKNNLALLYAESGDLARAAPLFEQVHERRRAVLGPDDLDTLQSMDTLGDCLSALGDPGRAVPLLEGAMEGWRAKLPAEHPNAISTMSHLARAYMDVGRRDEALSMQEEAFKLAETAFTREHPYTSAMRSSLAALYQRAGQLERALPLAREQVGLTRKAGEDSPQLAGALSTLGQVLLERGEGPEAESVLRECQRIRERDDPAGWKTFDGRSALGAALSMQDKQDEAGPLLRGGYDGLKARADRIPPALRSDRLGRALDRLIAWAEAAGKPDEAAHWRAEREAFAKESPSPPDAPK